MKNNSKKKYLINFLLIIVIGAAVIYFTMKDDLEASIEALLTASAGWIIVSLILMIIYYLV